MKLCHCPNTYGPVFITRVCLTQPVPVQELDDGERRSVLCGCGDPVQSSLPNVDKVKIFVRLQNKHINKVSSCSHCVDKGQDMMDRGH